MQFRNIFFASLIAYTMARRNRISGSDLDDELSELESTTEESITSVASEADATATYSPEDFDNNMDSLLAEYTGSANAGPTSGPLVAAGIFGAMNLAGAFLL